MATARFDASILIGLAGAGLLGYGLVQWQGLKHYSPEEIAAATELNLSFDLERLTPKPPPEKIEQMRAGVRREVQDLVDRPRDTARSFISAGAVLIVFAVLRRWLLRRLGQRTETPDR